MLECNKFYEFLNKYQVNFFTGVPDSLLKDFNAYILDTVPKDRHIISANEGAAVALATGYHLATGEVPLMYMQNSGQGNAVNPLTSLTDREVYSIPLLLLIGWRGQPGTKDEPQHVKQGKITTSLLETLDIEYSILPKEHEKAQHTVELAISTAQKKSKPYALIVQKDTFEPYSPLKKTLPTYELKREEAIRLITNHLNPADIIVSTTGKTSRELFEYRKSTGAIHNKDFLTVGSMGHASKIALGIALAKPNRQIYCFDGDGAALMHMGSMAVIGQHAPSNYKHIIFNNGAHDSVGGQPTIGHKIDFGKIAKACGYKTAIQGQSPVEIKEAMKTLIKSDGPSLLEILINKGARDDLGRPTTTPLQNKEAFMKNLKK